MQMQVDSDSIGLRYETFSNSMWILQEAHGISIGTLLNAIGPRTTNKEELTGHSIGSPTNINNISREHDIISLGPRDD